MMIITIMMLITIAINNNTNNNDNNDDNNNNTRKNNDKICNNNNDINDNFTKDMNVLKKHLNFLTGFNGISLQPLSGSHAELTALLIMKKYKSEKNEKTK